MKKYIKTIRETLYILTGEHKRLSVLVFILTAFGSVLECLGVSVIIPIVSLILSPDVLMSSDKLPSFLKQLEYETLTIVILMGVVALYIFKNLFFIFLSWFRNRFAYKVERELSVSMMKKYMSRGYEFFLSKSYAELNRSINSDINGVYQVLDNIYRFMSDMLTILLICGFLVFQDWKMTLTLGAVACLSLVIVKKTFHRSLIEIGKQMRFFDVQIVKTTVESVNGIKDVLVLRKQKSFVRHFEEAKEGAQHVGIRARLANECPTYVVEGMCIAGVMSFIAFRITSGADPMVLISTLAAMAVGAFRILPYIGKVSMEVNAIAQAMPRVDAVYEDLLASEEYNRLHPEVDYNLIEEITESDSDANFADELKVQDVSFAYSNEGGSKAKVLDGVNLTVKKGQSIALIGPSGAGKSTMVDVILGLLMPQQGAILMDGTDIRQQPDVWAKTVGYVSQTIFLSDDTIRRNVAFGESENEIDDDRVREAITRAELAEFVDSLPEGVNTMVGDRGTRLSGGQRQRIAIARALYHRPEILVLDEATSALDNDTEAAIMSAVESLQGQVTMIIVAHRLTTVRNCDKIYEVRDGQILEKTKEEVFS